MLDLDFKDFMDHLWIRAIDDQLDALAEKRIGNIFNFRFQREEPLLARNVGQINGGNVPLACRTW